MPRVLCLLLTAVILPSRLWLTPGLRAQTRAEGPAGAILYAVSYIEVRPSSEAAAIAALRQYRDTSRNEAGYIGFELFEQLGRPGHFAIIETWRDQKVFDAHGLAEQTRQLLSTLQAIRVSDHDQRLYQTLTVGSRPAPRAASGPGIYVVTHVDTAPPQGDAPGLLTRLAEASRKDEGNLRFDVLQHTTRANHFTVIEAWQSQKALDAHAAAAHTRQFREELHAISGSPLDERLYKIIE
jgi:quinol monooxygenase YgiN